MNSRRKSTWRHPTEMIKSQQQQQQQNKNKNKKGERIEQYEEVPF